jgi:hypothetical protein
LKAIEIPKTSLCKLIDSSPSGELIALGFDNGEIQIRLADKPERYMTVKMHDG